MKELIHPQDKSAMNWVKGEHEWGTVKVSIPGLNVHKETQAQDGILRERYIFTNTTDRYIFTGRTDVGIYATFNDNYDMAEICLSGRCHTHLFCGGDISYVMALRMNGQGPHLGLVLTEGSLCGYSVERNLELSSNDRGDFILHPSPVELLAPGESFCVGWTLFWHEGKGDFYRQLPLHNPRFVDVRANHYTLFRGENLELTVKPAFPVTVGDVSITCGDKKVPFTLSDDVIRLKERCDTIGERTYRICVGGVKTFCRILVQPEIDILAEKRCRFIARHQQVYAPGSPLDGAYLIYDNEDNRLHITQGFLDHSSARERIAMGVLLALYLKHRPDAELEKSLRRYVRFIDREIVDREKGIVYQEYGRHEAFLRLYNYPWAARFYCQLYELWQDKEDLLTAWRIMMEYYRRGGTKFYGFEQPLVELYRGLDAAGFTAQRDAFLEKMREHGETVLRNGLVYPPHEVRFEQSIVAPGGELLLKLYAITGEQRYLEGAKMQLAALDLFNGLQPDWHLHEVAIRHWDGYWFGKRKLYGDTFPHYWSGLTACNFELYAELTGDEVFRSRAEDCYRGVLGMIMPDGRASCAYLFPLTVNGQKGEFFDPYANDQDWGLVFYLRHIWK